MKSGPFCNNFVSKIGEMVARVWTDDLPKCAHTSAAVLDDNDQLEESLSFYCKINDNAYLYGVFEPHNGVEAARFILQRMAAEIIFNPFTQTSDEDVCELLRNAFTSVEKAYVQNYDEIIAERTSLQDELRTISDSGAPKFQSILDRLKQIDQTLSEGVTVVVALVLGEKLYVANVGSCRALLCRTDDNSVLRVVQLSAEHGLGNEDELLRLARLGLNVERLRAANGIGNQINGCSTRCLGNYLVKGMYRAFPDLCHATGEPVTAAAEIHGPITLTDSCRFLVLVNSMVYRRLQEIRGGGDQTNKQLAQIIVENFRNQTHLKHISSAVLSEILQQYRNSSRQAHSNVPMTLLIRNFNFPTPNAQEYTESVKQNVRFNPIVQSKSRTLLNDIESDLNTVRTNQSQATNQTTSSESSSDVYPNRPAFDKDKRIKGYVDFTCFYENLERAKHNGILPNFKL